MIRNILIFTLIFTLACTSNGEYKKIKQKGNFVNDLVIDSNTISSLISKDYMYRRHFLADFDNDSKSELAIICKSSENSDCLSMFFDKSCVYALLVIYKQIDNKWCLFLQYKLPDFENTYIIIDSLSNLIVTEHSKPSGYSRKDKTETYKFTKNEFILKKIELSIMTKKHPHIATDSDNWEYNIDFHTKTIEFTSFKYRLYEDENGGSKINYTDTTLQRALTKFDTIRLSEKYIIDSIIGKDYALYYY